MKVLVECYPDTALLRFLGIPRKRLFHERSKGNVINRLRESSDAIGMVDEDPVSGQHRDLANYHACEAAEGLQLLGRQSSSGQSLIVLCPKLEDWLIQRGRSVGIKPEDHGLPSDPDRLHSIPHYERKQGFHQFLSELMKQNDKGMGLLRQWVLRE